MFEPTEIICVENNEEGKYKILNNTTLHEQRKMSKGKRMKEFKT